MSERTSESGDLRPAQPSPEKPDASPKTSGRLTLVKLRDRLDGVTQRLEAADGRIRRDVANLQGAVDMLDAKGRELESTQKAALVRHIEAARAELGELMASTRSQVRADLRTALASNGANGGGGGAGDLDGVLARVEARIRDSEAERARQIGRLNSHLAEMARAVDARMGELANAQARESDVRRRAHGELADRIERVEQDTARAVSEMGERIVSLANSLRADIESVRAASPEMSVELGRKIEDVAASARADMADMRSAMASHAEAAEREGEETRRREESMQAITARLEALERSLAETSPDVSALVPSDADEPAASRNSGFLADFLTRPRAKAAPEAPVSDSETEPADPQLTDIPSAETAAGQDRPAFGELVPPMPSATAAFGMSDQESEGRSVTPTPDPEARANAPAAAPAMPAPVMSTPAMPAPTMPAPTMPTPTLPVPRAQSQSVPAAPMPEPVPEPMPVAGQTSGQGAEARYTPGQSPVEYSPAQDVSQAASPTAPLPSAPSPAPSVPMPSPFAAPFEARSAPAPAMPLPGPASPGPASGAPERPQPDFATLPMLGAPPPQPLAQPALAQPPLPQPAPQPASLSMPGPLSGTVELPHPAPNPVLTELPIANPGYAETGERPGGADPSGKTPRLGRLLRGRGKLVGGAAAVGLVALAGVRLLGAQDSTPALPGALAQAGSAQSASLETVEAAPNEVQGGVGGAAPGEGALAPDRFVTSAPLGTAPELRVPAVDPDSPEGRTLDAAVEAGDPIAQYQKGLILAEDGDVDAGVALVRLAADQGLPPAQYRLAKFYEAGEGVTQDIPTAVRLVELAARQGHRVAMHDLGLFIAEGFGEDPLDRASALEWFEKAAKLGIVDSQFNMAFLLDNGGDLGVERDPVAAYAWYAIAEASGDQVAGERLPALRAELDETQLADAQARVEAFRETPWEYAANGVFEDLPWAVPPGASALDREAVREVQSLLNTLGYETGNPDGEPGPRTREAIAAYERDRSLPETGEVSIALLRALQDDASS